MRSKLLTDFLIAAATACLTTAPTLAATGPDSSQATATENADQWDPNLRSGAAGTALKGPPSHDPAADGRAERVLGEKFDTAVTRSTADRAGESDVVRDRLGEGRLGVFYDHETDRRLQDTDDTVGLNVKLLEFR